MDKSGAKPTKQDLERSDLTHLAVLCQKVADNPSVDASTAEKARQLKHKWVVLIARETPPPPSLTEYDRIQAEKAALKASMIEFLVAAL